VEEVEGKEKFPVELFPKMGSNGFLCIWVPNTYGGRGGDKVMECIVIEELTRESARITGELHFSGGIS